jgi:hypothetical protein
VQLADHGFDATPNSLADKLGKCFLRKNRIAWKRQVLNEKKWSGRKDLDPQPTGPDAGKPVT